MPSSKDEGLTISVKEARKILGKDAEKMTDAEIEDTIEILDLLATRALELARAERHGN